MKRFVARGFLTAALLGVVGLTLAGCSDDSSSGTPSCPQGYVRCNDVCIDPAADSNYCGASGDCLGANAGVMCEDWEVCNGAGSCDLACQTGLVDCDGTCVDPQTDRMYCGATGDCTGASAGTTCADGEVCDAGVCSLSCGGGLVECNSMCIDPLTSRTNCGASGDCQGGNAGVACADGEICDGAGSCALTCQSGLIDCNGTCIDPLTNNTYCGASGDCQGGNAGVMCDAGETCDGTGNCVLSCQSGLIDCNGLCVDPDSNPQYCGASGDCQGANSGDACAADEACVDGHCVRALVGILYFSQDSNSNGLFWIDPVTGAGLHVGASGVTSSTVGLAYDPNLDLLYGTEWATLLHIARDGSGGTSVGGIGNEGLAYDPVGDVLYAAINGSFRSISRTDGTLVADLAAPGFDAEGLAIDVANGVVYAIGGSNTSLAVYDITNDSWSTVGDTTLGWDNAGLAYDPQNNILYAVANARGANLFEIDPATGAASLVGPTGIPGTHNGGLAFAPYVRPDL